MNILCALARGPLRLSLAMFGPRPRLCGRNPELLASASRARGPGRCISRFEERSPHSVESSGVSVIKHRRGKLGPKVEPALLAVVGVVIALSRAKPAMNENCAR